jgi:hypothetical protein
MICLESVPRARSVITARGTICDGCEAKLPV